MTQQWDAPVRRWAASIDRPPAAPAHVDAGLRRRLSALAKMSLVTLEETARGQTGLRIVYASRHGELERTTAMLKDMATDLELSPTAFSMSVLNATVGIDAIGRLNRAAATAVSAGAYTLGWALLEASLQQRANPQTPVLLLYADEPLPTLYGALPQDNASPIALGLLLDNEAEFRIRTRVTKTSAKPSTESQAMAFAQVLQDKGTTTWCDGTQEWSWSIEGA